MLPRRRGGRVPTVCPRRYPDSGEARPRAPVYRIGWSGSRRCPDVAGIRGSNRGTSRETRGEVPAARLPGARPSEEGIHRNTAPGVTPAVACSRRLQGESWPDAWSGMSHHEGRHGREFEPAQRSSREAVDECQRAAVARRATACLPAGRVHIPGFGLCAAGSGWSWRPGQDPPLDRLACPAADLARGLGGMAACLV
jgi:hypothetical protein